MNNPYAPGNVSPSERILAKLRAADAVSPASARSLDDLRCKADASWQSLVDEGRIREGAPGTFYLYERAAPASVAGIAPRARLAKTLVFWVIIMLIPIVLIELMSR
jgi:hypothetical protein